MLELIALGYEVSLRHGTLRAAKGQVALTLHQYATATDKQLEELVDMAAEGPVYG